MLASLVAALSDDRLRTVIDHVVSLPPQEDQATAHGYAKIVYLIPQQAWTTAHIDAIRVRSEDNFELQEEFEAVIAAADLSHRLTLQERIAGGDWAALEAYGDVRDLSSDTVCHSLQNSRLLSRLRCRGSDPGRAGAADGTPQLS